MTASFQVMGNFPSCQLASWMPVVGEHIVWYCRASIEKQFSRIGVPGFNHRNRIIHSNMEKQVDELELELPQPKGFHAKKFNSSSSSSSLIRYERSLLQEKELNELVAMCNMEKSKVPVCWPRTKRNNKTGCTTHADDCLILLIFRHLALITWCLKDGLRCSAGNATHVQYVLDDAFFFFRCNAGLLTCDCDDTLCLHRSLRRLFSPFCHITRFCLVYPWFWPYVALFVQFDASFCLSAFLATQQSVQEQNI